MPFWLQQEVIIEIKRFNLICDVANFLIFLAAELFSQIKTSGTSI